jgi:hypothetical protein
VEGRDRRGLHDALRAATLLRALGAGECRCTNRATFAHTLRIVLHSIALESRGGQTLTYIGRSLQIVESSRAIQWLKEAGC